MKPPEAIARQADLGTLSSPLDLMRRARESVMLVSVREDMMGRGSCDITRRSSSASSAAARALCSAMRPSSAYTVPHCTSNGRCCCSELHVPFACSLILCPQWADDLLCLLEPLYRHGTEQHSAVGIGITRASEHFG